MYRSDIPILSRELNCGIAETTGSAMTDWVLGLRSVSVYICLIMTNEARYFILYTCALVRVCCLLSACFPSRGLTVPPLQGDSSLTSFPLLFSRLHPAYIKCLQPGEILPSSLRKVKLCFFFPPPPPLLVYFFSPCLTSLPTFPCRTH